MSGTALEDEQPAEQRADYRFFRFLAVGGARLTVAGLLFAAWHLAWNRQPLHDTVIFLLSTTALALLVSLVAATVSYMLFKRRGGKIEKTPPPPDFGQPAKPL